MKVSTRFRPSVRLVDTFSAAAFSVAPTRRAFKRTFSGEDTYGSVFNVKEPAEPGDPVRVGIIGVGISGSMFLYQLWHLDGIHLIGEPGRYDEFDAKIRDLPCKQDRRVVPAAGGVTFELSPNPSH